MAGNSNCRKMNELTKFLMTSQIKCTLVKFRYFHIYIHICTYQYDKKQICRHLENNPSNQFAVLYSLVKKLFWLFSRNFLGKIENKNNLDLATFFVKSIAQIRACGA